MPDLLRIVVDDAGLLRPYATELLEQPTSLLEISELGRRDRSDRFETLDVGTDENQTFRLLVGKGLQQDSVDDTEDRRSGPNPDGEGSDGDGGNSGSRREHARAVTQVQPECPHYHDLQPFPSYSI